VKKNITLLFYWSFLILLTALFFIGTAFFSWFVAVILSFSAKGGTSLEKIKRHDLFIRTQVTSIEDDYIVTNLLGCEAVDCHMYVYNDPTKEVLLEKSDFNKTFSVGETVIVQLDVSERNVERKWSADAESTRERKVFKVLNVESNRFDLFGFDSYIFTLLFMLVPPFIVSSLVFRFMYKEIMPKKEAKKAKK
jgi:hypothetical protein